MEKIHVSPQATIWRWREEFQNDFLARMIWTITDNFDSDNHNPIVKTDNRVITAQAGEEIVLNVDANNPNDGEFFYHWFHYKEATGNEFYINLSDEKNNEIKFVVPENAKEDIHIILKVTNSGTPALSTYVRFIITIN